MLSSKNYVPVLSWRQAEYQALFRLPNSAKARIVPLVSIPRIEFDFDTYQPKHTVQEHVAPFPSRFIAKWGMRPAWVDVDDTLWLGTLDDGRLVHTFVLATLLAAGCNFVPVVHTSMPANVLAAIQPAASKFGVGLRVTLDELSSTDASVKFEGIVKAVGLAASDVDLIVDLKSPNYEPVPIFAKALRQTIRGLDVYAQLRSIVVVGTAFPESMSDVPPPGKSVPRLDWNLFKELQTLGTADVHHPTFGDYATVAPSFAADFDMRFVKPAGKLVYTTKNDWLIRKGGAFRDNPDQMYDHCDHVVTNSAFRGAAFSPGDRYIYDCAKKIEGTSNLTRWKEVAISHHIMQVLDDLAILAASAGTPVSVVATA